MVDIEPCRRYILFRYQQCSVAASGGTQQEDPYDQENYYRSERYQFCEEFR